VIRVLVIAVGLFLLGAAAVIARRPFDNRLDGGVRAFAFHVGGIACVGVLLIVGAVGAVPLMTIAYTIGAVGLSDVVVGIFARRW
jgi:hypothetical protein